MVELFLNCRQIVKTYENERRVFTGQVEENTTGLVFFYF